MADQGELIVATPLASPAPVPATPMEMLSRALERGADLTVLEKLMDLQERHERNQARKAFDAAVADAKAQIPVIKKNREGHNNKRYADLAAFTSAVDPVLARHGLSYRYRSRQDASIHVTCILSHRDGHCEETSISSGSDTTGNKNSVQAIGSTLTYLQRYTLKLALGLSAGEDDDDGQAAGGNEAINEEQAAILRDRIDETGADIARFCRYWKIEAIPDLRAKDFANALASLEQAAKSRKAKTGGGA